MDGENMSLQTIEHEELLEVYKTLNDFVVVLEKMLSEAEGGNIQNE